MSKLSNSHGGVGEEVKLDYGSISAQLGFLQGKVLTVIDASFTDERQLKAVKDLIKGAFRLQGDWIAELCFPDLPMKARDQIKASGVDVEAVERGAMPIEEVA